MIDGVLGYHLNPLTCGVAKFNAILARRVGVPALSIFAPRASELRRPLLSLRVSEFTDADADALDRLLDSVAWRTSFRLFLHGWSATPVERRLLGEAEVVYCANAHLLAELRSLRSDLEEAWCPSMLVDVEPFEETELSVFSFGMAHKVRADHYRRLDALLKATGRSYSLYLSTALHERTSFEDLLGGALVDIEESFGGRVYFLGYLSDAAAHHYLLQTTYFAAFFDRAVRANNTSVNAAMRAGAVVVTNLDAYSPEAFVHGVNVLDIRRCGALPTDPATLASIGERARASVTSHLGWEDLIAKVAARVGRELR